MQTHVCCVPVAILWGKVDPFFKATYIKVSATRDVIDSCYSTALFYNSGSKWVYGKYSMGCDIKFSLKAGWVDKVGT